MKNSTNGVFLLEVPAWNSYFVVYNENYVCLQVLEQKKKKKKTCWMDHAIRGGKLILFQRVVIIVILELHLWTHPLLLKNFFISFTNYFWNLLVLHTTKLYTFVCLFLFFIFMLLMLFASMTLLDMTKQPSCIRLSKHMAIYYLNGKDILYIPYAPVKWSIRYQVNKLPLFELWKLMVNGKKSFLSRILVLSSLPHSVEFKRLSTSLFLLSLPLLLSIILNFPMLRLWC